MDRSPLSPSESLTPHPVSFLAGSSLRSFSKGHDPSLVVQNFYTIHKNFNKNWNTILVGGKEGLNWFATGVCSRNPYTK